ncbi:MAG: small subunit ribosomal protein [Patescibacteria group bacterium]|nr:small subunit ribosomal protein [Patescibacteria group bacterium]
MDKNIKEDRSDVYEIGYLLVSSIPEEKVASETAALKEALSKKGAEFIGEEAPELRTLAYTMTKKIGTSNQRFDQGYFGWFKFEMPVKEIEGIKKSFEANPHMLRMLVITTVRENTYLGKKSPTASVIKAEEMISSEVAAEPTKEAAPVAPASIEEMDKSIDAMVKEA